MVVNGFQLREAIRQWELTRDGAAGEFESTLKKFPDEIKAAPGDVMVEFLGAEAAIAEIQRAQAIYNLAVTVTVLETPITLLEAVKRLGGAGRAAKMWRTAAGGDERKRRNVYGLEETRKTDEVRAVPTITREEAQHRAKVAEKYASALRAAIAKGNTTDVDVIDLDPALLA